MLEVSAEQAYETVNPIEAMLSLGNFAEGQWRPPIMTTVATTGRGVAELVDTIERFRGSTADAQGTRRRARAEWRVRELLGQRFLQHIERHVLGAGEFEQTLDRIAAREIDPYTAVDDIFRRAVQQP